MSRPSCRCSSSRRAIGSENDGDSGCSCCKTASPCPTLRQRTATRNRISITCSYASSNSSSLGWCPSRQLMGGQQPNIAQTRNRGVQLRQCCQQETRSRMMVPLTQRHSRQTLHMRSIKIMTHHRLLTRRSIQRHPPTIRRRVESKQQHRASPPSPPLRPRPPHHWSVGLPSRLHLDILKRLIDAPVVKSGVGQPRGFGARSGIG